MERHDPRPQKITFGKMRSNGGPTGILISRADYRCSHLVAMSADYWSDAVRLSDIEPQFVCKACGKRGADVRPNFAAAQKGR
nr:helix-turn-helix domain of transposase family ISL3 [uncultured bacterium]